MPGTLAITLNALEDIAGRFIDTTFPDVCSISRKAEAANVTAYGSTPPSYSNVATNVNCAWGPAGKNAKEYMRALQLTGVTVYLVSMKAGIDVKPKDRIVIAARGDEPARIFEVKGPAIRNSGVTIDVLCTLEE
jgi:hypothetical protein